MVVVGWPMSKARLEGGLVMTGSNQFVEGQNNIFSGGKPAKLPSASPYPSNGRNPDL